MEKIRSFIAIDLPIQLLEQIIQLQKELIPATRDFVRWTRPENIHLTLKFLGDVDKEKLLQAKRLLDEIKFDHTPFILCMEGYGVFPNKKQPRIIWVGFEESQSILVLVSQINTKLQTLGIEPEIRPYKPHLTIGRVRQISNAYQNKVLDESLSSAKRIVNSFSVTEFKIYKSMLTPDGPKYTQLFGFKFSPII